MATVYHFLRGDDSLRLAHDGAVLITGEGADAVVQRFDSGAAARAHLERVLQQRVRSGYRIQTSEMATEPGQYELAEVAEFVTWDEAEARLRVTFKTDARGLSDKIVACAAAKSPLCLRIACDPSSPGPAFAQAVAATTLPSVRRFVFDTHFQTLDRQRSNSIGDLTDLLAGLPALEQAFLSGELMLRPCTHTSVRDLFLLGDPLMPSTLSALGRCTFPSLERLGLALQHEQGGSDRQAVKAIHGVEAEVLGAVHVAGVADITAFLTALLARPLSTGWSLLHVNGTITDEDGLLGFLESHAVSLRRLETLALPLCDYLSSEADERARALVPGLVDCEERTDPFLPATYEAW